MSRHDESICDENKKVRDDSVDDIGVPLLKIFDKYCILNDREKLIMTSHAQYTKWQATQKAISTIKTLDDSPVQFQSALEYFAQSEKYLQIKFNVPTLDKLTEGGVDVGSITEIYGESGSGKTQLCLQLTLSACRPAPDGLAGKAVYISTDKSFPSLRLAQMASSQQQEVPIEDILDNVYVWSFNTYEDLKGFLESDLPILIIKHTGVKLVVIDSIAGIFRIENDYIKRAKQMREVALRLEQFADKHDFAIVVTNHITAVPQLLGVEKTIASLGPAWDSLVVTKFLIEKTEKLVECESLEINRIRTMEVIYSPRLPCAKAKFLVDYSGIV